jgi:hypothetical protein
LRTDAVRVLKDPVPLAFVEAVAAEKSGTVEQAPRRDDLTDTDWSSRTAAMVRSPDEGRRPSKTFQGEVLTAEQQVRYET